MQILTALETVGAGLPAISARSYDVGVQCKRLIVGKPAPTDSRSVWIPAFAGMTN
jgi:hypothetical protein